MFSNAYQSGFISIFYSVGSNPLSIWNKEVRNGHIRRVIDDEVRSLVLEIAGTNVSTTYITCPPNPKQTLGIKLPFLVMVIKNMKKYFTFEIQIRDDKGMHRRFRVSNFQSSTKVQPFCTSMPIGLSSGWNQVQFNLADFTKRAYGSTYLETMRVQIHANVRIRRIYFSDMLYSDDEMPNEFKLFVPGPALSRGKDKKDKDKEKVEERPSKEVGKKGEEGDESVPPPPASPVGEEDIPREEEAEPVHAAEEPEEVAGEAEEGEPEGIEVIPEETEGAEPEDDQGHEEEGEAGGEEEAAAEEKGEEGPAEEAGEEGAAPAEGAEGGAEEQAGEEAAPAAEEAEPAEAAEAPPEEAPAEE